jgi:TolB-like protein
LSLFAELKRRKVIRVAVVYAATAFAVLQAADIMLPRMGVPDWGIGLIIALIVLGFPIALVLGWALELTPEGIRRTESAAVATGEVSAVPALLGKRTVLIAALLVAVGVGLGAGWFLKPGAPEPITAAGSSADAATVGEEQPSTPMPVEQSIAVLPFADLSPAGDQEYFSDGIAEEILNALARVEGLAVASRTSAFQFKGREIGIPGIAQALGVRHVLEGSVRKAGDSLRITAQLIDASNDRHLWSETFDRLLTAENVFQIQDEIAVAITGALGVAMKLGSEQLVSSAGATDDIDAYALYLEARTLYHRRKDLDRVDRLLERALEHDPSFARAWELRAPIPTLAIDYGDSSEPLEAAEARSHRYADRALALNPESSLALATLGKNLMQAGMNLRGFSDFASALDYFERAVAADPNNASAFLWRGNLLESLGFVEEALAAYEQCVALEPLYRPCVSNRPPNLIALGRFEEALAMHRQNLGGGLSQFGWGLIELWVKMESELLFMEAANHPDVLSGFPRQSELYAAHLEPAGDHTELVADALKYRPRRSSHGFTIDWLLVPLGHTEISGLWATLWGESFRRFRQSEEFRQIMRDTGVLAYWRAHRFPPLCRPGGAEDFECD